MKTGLISLSLIFATGVALAQGTEPPQAAEPAAATTAAQGKRTVSKPRPRQGGDIRECLDRKTNKEIHRCAQKKRGK